MLLISDTLSYFGIGLSPDLLYYFLPCMVIIASCLYKYIKYNKGQNKIPGPWGVPILGKFIHVLFFGTTVEPRYKDNPWDFTVLIYL